MFDGFETRQIDVGTARLNVRLGGSGPPLLMVHGYPQTGAMWAPIAAELAKRFSLIIPDLRGYGRSDKPATDATHSPYSKRAMADDLARLMTALGHEKFQVAAHDRGARVTHRLCLDHPARVQRAAVLDIAPTKHIFDTADQALATAYYHWFFLIQPAPFPETLIGHDPVHFLRWTLKAWSAGRDDFFAPDAMAEYEACFSDPAVIHASCEDYRAGATIDLDHDAADIDQRIACPLLVLWGSNGAMEKLYDVLATWVPRADDLRGHMVEGGHFMAEENPEATLAAFADFFEI